MKIYKTDPKPKFSYAQAFDNICNQVICDAEDLKLLLDRERPNVELALVLVNKMLGYAEDPARFNTNSQYVK